MRVKELIDILREFDPELGVRVYLDNADSHAGYREMEVVDVEEDTGSVFIEVE